MIKKIESKFAPEAIGAYNQAIKYGNIVFTSGQIGLTTDGEIVPGNIEEQTHQVMKNISYILEASGTSLKQVIKTTCFINDMNNFQRFDAVYSLYFSNILPARSCVEVSQLPKKVLVEIEVIAAIDI